MTTPSPGRGWRWLRVGAIRRKGDEYTFKGRWHKYKGRGWPVFFKHMFRRRVKKGKR